MYAITSQLTDYKINVGHFPDTAEGLRALVRTPGYLDRMPKDAWGNRFKYALVSTGSFLIRSIGAD